MEPARLTLVAAAIEPRLITLEANYIDRDADYSKCITDLEALHVAHMTDERDTRMAALEKAIMDLEVWRPNMEGIVDDMKLWV